MHSSAAIVGLGGGLESVSERPSGSGAAAAAGAGLAGRVEFDSEAGFQVGGGAIRETFLQTWCA